MSWFFGSIPGPLGSPSPSRRGIIPDILAIGMYRQAELWLKEEGITIEADKNQRSMTPKQVSAISPLSPSSSIGLQLDRPAM